MSTWFPHRRLRSHRRPDLRPRLLGFDKLESRRVLSSSHFTLSWAGGEFGEAAEHEEDHDTEERREVAQTSALQHEDYEDDDVDRDDVEHDEHDDAGDHWEEDDHSEYAEIENSQTTLGYDDDHREDDERWEDDDHREDDDWEDDGHSKDEEHWEDDERWETEEEHEVINALTDNLIRSSLVPPSSSSVDELQDDAGSGGSDPESVDNFTNPVGTSLKDEDTSVVSNSAPTTSADSNRVDADDTRADRDDDRESATAGENEQATVSSDTGEESAAEADAESAQSNADQTHSAETTKTNTATEASVQQVNPNRRADQVTTSFRTANQSADDSTTLVDGRWAAVLPAVATATDGQDLFRARLAANAAVSQDSGPYEHPASASALTSNSPRGLFDSIPQDLAGLEQALQTLLHDQRQIGQNLVDWVKDPNVLRWILASSVAVVAFEAARRKARRTSPDVPKRGDSLSPDSLPPDSLPPDNGHAALLCLFPELFGLAPVSKQ